MVPFLPLVKEMEDHDGDTKFGNLRVTSDFGCSSVRDNRSRRRQIADLQILG